MDNGTLRCSLPAYSAVLRGLVVQGSADLVLGVDSMEAMSFRTSSWARWQAGILPWAQTASPAGEIAPVEGTPMDFRVSTAGGARYGRRDAVCLEMKFFPDMPNHPGVPQCVLRPGEAWEHETVIRFSRAGEL